MTVYLAFIHLDLQGLALLIMSMIHEWDFGVESIAGVIRQKIVYVLIIFNEQQ